jgi:hypothetical protein
VGVVLVVSLEVLNSRGVKDLMHDEGVQAEVLAWDLERWSVIAFGLYGYRTYIFIAFVLHVPEKILRSAIPVLIASFVISVVHFIPFGITVVDTVI